MRDTIYLKLTYLVFFVLEFFCPFQSLGFYSKTQHCIVNTELLFIFKIINRKYFMNTENKLTLNSNDNYRFHINFIIYTTEMVAVARFIITNKKHLSDIKI